MPVGLNHQPPPPTAATSSTGRLPARGDLQGEVSTLYRYRPETRNRWSRLPNAPTKGSTGRRRDPGQAYAAGGADAAHGAPGRSRSTASASPLVSWTRHWRSRASISRVRSATGVLRARGTSRRQRQLQGRRALLPRQGRWDRLRTCGSRAAGSPPPPVSAHRRLRGRRSAGTIAEVEVYDPVSRRWSPLPDSERRATPRGDQSRASRVRDRGAGRPRLRLLERERGARPGISSRRRNEQLARFALA